VIYDGPIEIVLRREMAEDERFAHAGRLSDLSGRRSVEALSREEFDGRVDDLPTPIFDREAPGFSPRRGCDLGDHDPCFPQK
jgi:hypothetical protein